MMPDDAHAAIAEHLDALYGDRGPGTHRRLREILDRFRARTDVPRVPPQARLSEADSVLIAYADQVRDDRVRGDRVGDDPVHDDPVRDDASRNDPLRDGAEPPLRTLARLLEAHAEDAVTGVHLLPFYPSTSDDGFAVADYLAVDPRVGDWEDVERLGASYRLMFDAVVNHVSASHPWFRKFLAGEAPYDDYFISVDPATDLSSVVRPRATPLLTPFATAGGTKHVWTTFSADQVDLNYANPDVLLEAIEVLLEYVRRGADILRLDAVTFLWKEVGTSCVHHPHTHRILKLMRAVMEAVAPRVVLLTETNVPHEENVGYFGNGRDEAQMVYNFALPPLVLHAFQSGDAGALQAWAKELACPSDQTAFFNFLASHDGIGLRPVEGILPPDAVAAMVERVRAHGGLVSTKRNSDGSESPYELNIGYFDALSDPGADEPLDRQVGRFLTAHAIMLALAGVPGIYVHSLFGSRSDHDALARTGRARSINRGTFVLERLERELADPGSRRRRVLNGLRVLLRARRGHAAFAPWAEQRVLDTPAGVFGVRRGEGVYCLHNVTDRPQTVAHPEWPERARDLLTGAAVDLRQGVRIAPAAFAWLEAEAGAAGGAARAATEPD